jgi:hypothetical protein
MVAANQFLKRILVASLASHNQELFVQLFGCLCHSVA